MKRVLLNRKLGFFLGAYQGFPLFSSFRSASDRAAAFYSDEDAQAYLDKNFSDRDDMEIVAVESSLRSPYVTCVELIRAGYGEYTKNMIDFMPNASKTRH